MLIKSEDTKELNKAILTAQSKFPIIGKTKVNDFYKKSKYAAYDDVYAGVKPILVDAGLIVEHEHKMEYKEVEAIVIVKQTVIETGEVTEQGGGKQIDCTAEVVVSTSIIHAASGQYKTITSSTFPDKTSMHGVMAAVTYLKRYNLTSILDIAVGDEDDDGNGGLNRPEDQYDRKYPKAPAQQNGKSTPPKQQAGLTGRNTAQVAQELSKKLPPNGNMPQEQLPHVENYTKEDFQPQPDDLPFDGNAGVSPGTTETAPDRPMTDKERQRLGKIDKDQVESLKEKLSSKGINKDKWKAWLDVEYGFGTITDITTDVYTEICRVVTERPDAIMTPGASTK